MQHDRFWGKVRADWKANDGWGGRALLFGHRVAAATLRLPFVLRWLTVPIRVLHHLFVRVAFAAIIPPAAELGSGVVIRRANGLAIHHQAVIGAGCLLRHNVTIGARRTGESAVGVPTLAAGVDVGAGAMVLGPITIGVGAKIGAGAIVLHDVPPGGVVVGNPARLLPARDVRTPGHRRGGGTH